MITSAIANRCWNFQRTSTPAFPNQVQPSQSLPIILFIIIYMATNSDIETQKQLYRNIIASKAHSPNSGKIAYDWRKAELSILQSIQQQFSAQGIIYALQKSVTLQQQYANKHFPPFYCFYTLQTFLKAKESFLSSIDEEIRKVQEGNSDYEQMAIPLMLQQTLFETICKQSFTVDTQQITQLEQLHVLAILKINQWQIKTSTILKYPAFFFWNQTNYILSLRGPSIDEPQLQIQSKIHQFLIGKSMKKTNTFQQCERLISVQKARELQLILNLPFFASLRKQQARASPELNRKSSFVSVKRSLLKPAKNNLKIGLEDLKSEELEVLRKFRSLKSIKVVERQKTTIKTGNQEKSSIKQAIRDKLITLKEKVKLNDSNIRPKQTQPDRISQADKKIKLLFEKDIQLINKAKPYQKIDFQDLRNQRKQTEKQSPQESKKQLSLRSLQKAARQLVAQKLLKQSQIQEKSTNLQAIKLELISKVKEKRNNSTKTLKGLQRSRDMSPSAKQQQQFSIEKSKELRQLNPTKTQQAKDVGKFTKFEKQQQQLAAVVKQKLRNGEKLSLKSQKVRQLQQKLQQLKKSMPEQVKADQQSTKKIKKQIQFEVQKQKISNVSKQLQQRVRAEEEKYQNLKRLQQQREKEIQRKLEREVDLVQEQLGQQTRLQQERMRQEQLRRQQYQAKIAAEKEENERMLKQIEEWDLKERELLLLIEQEKQNRKLKQEHALAEQRKKWQQQLALIENQETQLINQYRASNQNLVSMLQLLKHKNYQIQAKLKQKY